MRRLPKVNQLVAQVTQHVAAKQASALQKQASAPAPEYIVPVARELKKIAELCRVGTPMVSVADVEEFAQRLMR